MKIIFSAISRLIFSYTKFLASLILLSNFTNFAQSYEETKYLKYNDEFNKLKFTQLETHYNIRTKKVKIIYG